MRLALIVSGVLASIAMLAPVLVVVGYFFFIIPGLVLTLAPTLFVYLSATAAIRHVLPIENEVTATTLSMAIAIAVSWAVMLPLRSQATREYQAQLQPDVPAASPISLAGNVRLEMTHSHLPPAECDYLCAALLEIADVSSVTVQRQNGEAAFRLTWADEHSQPGLFPTRPGDILAKSPAHRSVGSSQNAAKIVEANWALRLATEERLVETTPIPAARADWVLRITSQRQRRRKSLHRVEIIDGDGNIRFRTSEVSHMIPAAPFYFGFDANLAAGSLSDASFGVGRRHMRSGRRYLGSSLEQELLAAIHLPIPELSRESLHDLRQQVQLALQDQTADAARLELANRWLSLFWFDAAAEDLQLIAQIVADRRVLNVAESLQNVFQRDKIPPEMSVPLAQRIAMPHSSAKDRMQLARNLASMPDGTFANPHHTHRAIWDDPDLLKEAAPFVERLADLGGDQGTDRLMAALEATVELPHWTHRRQLVAGIRAGFERLGTAGAAALPRLRELFLRRPSPITNTANDARKWRLAFAAMGVAVDELPFYSTQSDQSIQRDKQRIREHLERKTANAAKRDA